MHVIPTILSLLLCDHRTPIINRTFRFMTVGLLKVFQSINHAAGDASYVNLKKRIAGADTVRD